MRTMKMQWMGLFLHLIVLSILALATEGRSSSKRLNLARKAAAKHVRRDVNKEQHDDDFMRMPDEFMLNFDGQEDGFESEGGFEGGGMPSFFPDPPRDENGDILPAERFDPYVDMAQLRNGEMNDTINGQPELHLVDTVSMSGTIEEIRATHSANEEDRDLNMRAAFNEFLIDSATGEGSCYMQTYKGVNYANVVEAEVKSFCSYIPMNFTDAQFEWIASLGSEIQSKKSSTCSSARTVRKEIRRYTAQERQEIYQAIVDMKNTYIDDRNQYDMFAEMHRPTSGPSGTRAGVATWGWHREYLFRFERAMQQHNANVSLPYWDTSLDRYIPYPSHTALFSSSEFGSKVNGVTSVDPFKVTDGPFANWEIYETCADAYGHPHMDRTVAERGEQMPRLYSYSRWEIENYLLNMTSFTDLATDVCLLRDHDNLHGYIGGVTSYEMEKSCAVIDPIVWFMHNYLDYIWQQFREKAQKTDLNSDYTTGDTVQACHTWDAEMYPFEGMKNIDGLSDAYQSCYYTFEESPSLCETTSDCGSDLLWCDTTIGWCKSKIATGGMCTMMTDESCVSGSCVVDTCTASLTDDEEEAELIAATNKKAKRMWVANHSVREVREASHDEEKPSADAAETKDEQVQTASERKEHSRSLIDAIRLQGGEDDDAREKKKTLFAKLVTLLAERIFGQNRATSVV